MAAVWMKKFRLRKGWSQEQLAEMAGLSVRTVQRLEKGHPASMESLKALASVFELELSQLPQEPSMNPQEPSQISGATHAIPSPWITREEEQAIQYVEHVKGFYIHLLIFLLVMPALTVFNVWVSPQAYWFVYVLVPWSLALLLQAALTFPVFRLFGPEWERRQVEKRLGRKL